MAHKIIRLLTALALSLFVAQPRPADASQASCVMPTTGTVSGLTLVNDINACNQAILSVYTGATAPSVPNTAMFWYDTSTSYLRQYDGATWVPVWFIDSTNHLVASPIGGGVANFGAAATVDLGTSHYPFVSISGLTSISSFGTTAPNGSVYILFFNSSLTLTAGSSLVLPGGAASMVTTPGDLALAIRIGSGAWWLIYQPITSLVQYPAFSFSGNNSSGVANPSPVTIPGLPSKASPTGSDSMMIADAAASNSWKQITLSQIAAIVGVTSFDGQTGPFTAVNGFSCPSRACGLTAARRTLPTTTPLASGSGTYTVPANVLWLEIRVVGGGSGGGGGNNASLSTAGGSTCLAASGAACSSPILVANGGAGSGTPTVGVGGTASGGFLSISGSSGSPGGASSTAANGSGGSGGASCLGGGAPGSTGAGPSAAANSGAGGGGGGSSNATISGAGGSGGAAGGCVLAIINSPAASYTYAVGAGGAGAGGVNVGSSVGGSGGTGGSGIVMIIEHYGS